LAKAFLTENCGVPDSSDSSLTTVSRNTYENAVETKKIMNARRIKIRYHDYFSMAYEKSRRMLSIRLV
jgi:hypothetical protein